MSSTSEPQPETSATVRPAAVSDFESLRELILDRSPSVDARALTADLLEHGETFVLEFSDHRLAAAARVRIEDDSARLDFLMVAHEASAEIEARMIAIAEALATAHGCDTLDVR